jgi:hypothetical protein
MGLDGFDGMGMGWKVHRLVHAGVLVRPLSPSSLLNAAASYVHSRKHLHH